MLIFNPLKIVLLVLSNLLNGKSNKFVAILQIEICQRNSIEKLHTNPTTCTVKFPFIWPSGFREEDLKKIDRSETRIAYGGHVC